MKKTNTVWIVDDDKSIRWVLEKALQKASITTKSFTNAHSLLEALEHDVPTTLITDIRMPGINGLELLSKVQYNHPDLP
ncbi:MAG: response regulator, partial [Methylococcales bacterium]